MKTREQDIGELKGKALFFGGAYSNLEALQRIFAIAEEEGIPRERIIGTGDAVGYCADPEAVVQELRERRVPCIAGNVELSLREGETDCGCNFDSGSRCDALSAIWYPYAQAQVSEGSIEWMKDLPDHLRFRIGGWEGVVVHGSCSATSAFIFASTPWERKKEELEEAGADLIIGGHCGIPFIEEQDAKVWLNAGVIGMPANDGTARCWYAVLEPSDEGVRYRLRSFRYAHEEAQRKMRERGLPEAYAKTLADGYWDNCEILPERETEEQGVPLEEREGMLERN